MAELVRARHPARLVAVLALIALAAVTRGLLDHLPIGAWWAAIRHPDLDDTRQLIIVYSVLPRLATSLLAGAALGLAGAIFQHVLRNPIADPTTLGVSAGASLALSLSLAFAPHLLAQGREWVALLGAGLASLAVFGIGARRDLAPLTLVLAGMVVTLFCGALAAGIQLFDNAYTRSIYLWGAGSLAQQDWSVVLYLAPRVAASLCVVALLVRPLELMGLDDASARGLGLRLFAFRIAALAVAAALSGFVVSAVGVIGFVGLAAPVVVRLAGARRLSQQLIWAPLLGAALLCLTDESAQWFNGDLREVVPTGAATALFGAPLLLWMLPRLGSAQRPSDSTGGALPRTLRGGRLILGVTIMLGLAAVVFLHLGRDGHGWRWSSGQQLALLLPWRGPRLLGSIAAGAMLAMAGTLLQRMTGNPLASPEILGISGGAALGMILVVSLVPEASRLVQCGACAASAGATLALILALGRRMSYAPERILLAGLMVGALSGCLIMIFSVSGNPQLKALQSWMAGGTDQITQAQAIAASASAGVMLALMPLLRRWLDILPLGSVTARAVGVDVGRSRMIVLVGVAVSTASATLLVGPLGFVGLLGPHLARTMGASRPLEHVLGAAALGALLMALADWLGRIVLFPYQAPTGLIATLVGTPYLIWLLMRRVG